MRITRKMVDARIESVNVLLGHGENPAYSTVGAVTLGSAYGGYRVERYCNDAGAVSTLTNGYGTLREAYGFLQGMLSGLRISKEI